jgi:hypothetical protein
MTGVAALVAAQCKCAPRGRSGPASAFAAKGSVTASALTTLVDRRRLDRLFPGSPSLAAIDALTVDSSRDVFLHANYYAAHRDGCGNVRAELTAAGRLKVLRRSAAGLTCG